MMQKFLKSHFTPIHVMGIVVLFMFFCQDVLGQNLVINGDFEAGNLVGFSSNYQFIPTPTGTTNAGQYGIGKNPQPFNTASFLGMGDHTSGSGNMMIVDGTNNGGNTEPSFWRINNSGEICGLMVGESYTFSYYVKSIYKNDIAGASSADIGIKWNNVQGQTELGILAPTSGNMLVLPPVADWQRVTYTFIPTNSCVRIEMFDRNSNLAGNDFAIDDIELLPPLQPLQLRFALISPGCPNGSDGFIAAYGRGGKAPYSFSFNGGPFSSNSVLANLGAVSGQSITVRDASLPPTEVSATGIGLQEPANTLDAGPNGSVCAGQVYQLNASGGSSYTWTSTPEDTSLKTPNIANPTVRPLVNTVYKVTSQVSSVRNLIYNGNFNDGDVGFASDYSSRLSNPNGLQGVYGIVSNAQGFYNPFSACTGTGGTGDPMFVADGSTKMDTRVWWQEVSVQPNTNYTFSYYLQSVQAGSPALIETQINNLPITGNTGTSTRAAPNATCTWQQVTYTWNSGSNTSALIALFNRNLASGGNDFALDNILFTTNMLCTVSREVAVNVTREEAPKADLLVQPTCANPAGSFRVIAPFPPGSDFQYSLDGIIFQDNPQFTNLLPGTYTAYYRRKATGCISSFTPVVLNAPSGAPPVPTAIIKVQTGCNISTGTIEVTSPTGSGFEYSINGTRFQTSTTFSGLKPGTYKVSVKNQGSLCINSGSDLVINPVPAIPSIPAASVTAQPTCNIKSGTITFTSPIGPDYQYTVNGTIFRPDPVFSSLSPGTYLVSVKNIKTGCVSPPRSLKVNDVPGAPPAAISTVSIQPNCYTPTGTISISSPIGTQYEYSLDSVNYQDSPIFSNVLPGKYNIRTRNKVTTCLSNSLSLTVNPVPGNPAVPVVTVSVQPTCTVLTGTLLVTEPLGTNFDYSIDGINYQAGPSFSGLAPGTYNVRVRNVLTGCFSDPSSVTINFPPSTPATPTAVVAAQPTCTIPLGTISVSSPTGSNLAYSIDGVTYQAGNSFSGLNPGQYNVRARNTSTGCTSSLLPLVVNPVPLPPAAPQGTVTVQPTCTIPTGTIVLTSPAGTGLEYSLNGTNWQAGLTFSGLSPNIYEVRVRNIETTCVSSLTTLVVNAVPDPPAAPVASVIVQPTCTIPSGTIEIKSPVGSGLEYSVDGVAWKTGLIFSGLTPKTYNVGVRNTATGCISGLIPLVVNEIPGLPMAPTGTIAVQPTCVNPTGSLQITEPLGSNLEYGISPGIFQTGTLFSSLNPGVYEVRVKNVSTGCISNAAQVVINAVPVPPQVPSASVTVQPTCITPAGTIVITAPTGAGLEYSLNGTSWQAGTNFSGLLPGDYKVQVRNPATACTGNNITLRVNAVPLPPAIPAASVTAQPTCSSPAGTVVIASPTGADLEYSLNEITWQRATTFQGVLPGAYSVWVRSAVTGCSSKSAPIEVSEPPFVPVTPVARVSIQPDCSVATGTILITSPIGNELEYGLNGTNWQTGTTFSGLLPNIYNLQVRNKSGGCISNSLALEVIAPPVIPATPVAVVTVQPDCSVTTGTITVTSPTGPLLDYSVDGVNFQVGMTFTGLLPGNYAVRARNNITGCISNLTRLVIDPAPPLPPAPVVNTPVTHCQFSGNIPPLTAAGTNLKWYNVPTGGTGSSLAPVPGVTAAGSTLWYVSQTNASGCEGPRSAIEVIVSESPVITIPVNSIEIQYGQSVSLPATITGQGVTIRWTPSTGLNNPAIEQPLARPENTITYSVVASSAQACTASNTIRVVVLKDIIVPNVFSPNGDGINDKWVIKHLEDYPNASLEVFDRYGKSIFAGKTASMPWDGTVGGKQIPAGTYYYIIKLGNNKLQNGSVTVVR